MTHTLHAHVHSESRDCDGSYTRRQVVTLDTDELHELALVEYAERTGARPGSDFHDIHFRERVVGMFANVYAIQDGYEQTITIRSDGFEAHQPTEEGSSHVWVEWCEDARCDQHARSSRDHRAEAMGY